MTSTISEDEIDIPYPPFPVDSLPAVLKETVSNIREKTNVPEAIIAYQCLGILSGVVGNSIQSKLGSLPIYPNLFIIGVEYSGVGKTKSASILCRGLRQALFPWIDESNAKKVKAEMEWEELNKLYKKQFRENEQRADSQEPKHDLKPLVDRITILQRQKNIRGDIIISDITPEKMASAMEGMSDHALLSFSSDARQQIESLLNGYGSNKSSTEGAYLQFFSHESFSQERKTTQSVSINEPCLALQWNIQMDKFDKLTSSEVMRESGFVGRTLFASSGVRKTEWQSCGSDHSINTEGWDKLMLDLIQLRQKLVGNSQEPVRIQIIAQDPREFDRVLEDFHGNLPSFHVDKEHENRQIEILLRLALVLAIADQCQVLAESPRRICLKVSHLQQGMTILDWFNQCRLRLMSSGRFNSLWNILLKIFAAMKKERNADNDKFYTCTSGRLTRHRTVGSLEELKEVADTFPQWITLTETERQDSLKVTWIGGNPR